MEGEKKGSDVCFMLFMLLFTAVPNAKLCAWVCVYYCSTFIKLFAKGKSVCLLLYQKVVKTCTNWIGKVAVRFSI